MGIYNPVDNSAAAAAAAANMEKNLKIWYEDRVETLLKKNSSALREVPIIRVEGKQQNFSAIYSRGGAVSSNALYAEAKAANNVKNAEFTVTPGQLFSVFSYNVKEVQASMSKRGAYMKVAGRKAYAATEALRKTLAAAYYGRGFGELQVIGTANATAIAAGVAAGTVDVTLAPSVIMKIDVDSDLVLKSSISSATEKGLFTVQAINGDTVTLLVGTADATAAATDVLVLRGSMDGAGNANMPVGLDGWLPIVAGRDNSVSDWTNYIATPFFGVNRSVNVEGCAGSFYYNASSTSLKKDIQELLRRARRQGSEADFIIMNDADFLALDEEINTTNTYFTQTSTRSKRQANIGLDKVSASFSTNFIDLIYDDPFCPEGKFYILDKKDVELWAYTNAEIAEKDGISGNNPGKQDPEEFDNKGHEDESYKLLIDDILTVEPGAYTRDGASVRCTLNLLGSFVVLNPSNAGVGIWHTYTPSDVIGYSL